MIEDRVRAALERAEATMQKSERASQCFDFVRQMQQAGVLRPQEYTVKTAAEGDIDQLRTMATTSL